MKKLLIALCCLMVSQHIFGVPSKTAVLMNQIEQEEDSLTTQQNEKEDAQLIKAQKNTAIKAQILHWMKTYGLSLASALSISVIVYLATPKISQLIEEKLAKKKQFYNYQAGTGIKTGTTQSNDTTQWKGKGRKLTDPETGDKNTKKKTNQSKRKEELTGINRKMNKTETQETEPTKNNKNEAFTGTGRTL